MSGRSMELDVWHFTRHLPYPPLAILQGRFNDTLEEIFKESFESIARLMHGAVSLKFSGVASSCFPRQLPAVESSVVRASLRA